MNLFVHHRLSAELWAEDTDLFLFLWERIQQRDAGLHLQMERTR